MSRGVFIYGPTAVGKTDFAHKLALQMPCDIINMDVGQLYTPLTIGTAKPDWQNSQTPHHMFDVCPEPDDYSVTTYHSAVKNILDGVVHPSGRVPVFVGGSGFYMNSLLFPPIVHKVSSTRVSVDEYSWERLHAIDPLRATEIHPHDTYRIQRALNLYQQTNALPSELKPLYCPIIEPFFIFLNRSGEDLKVRIEYRVGEMLKRGWQEEVKALIGTPWEPFLLRKKWIGYPDIIDHCTNYKKSLADVQKNISRKTWQYARKQLSYARMFVKKMESATCLQIPSVQVDLTSHENALDMNTLITMILS